MLSHLPSAKGIAADSIGGEVETSPIMTEMNKKTQFYHFLQKEMNTARTEAEKEAVLGILLKTKIEIRALERQWKQIQAIQRSARADSEKLAALYPTRRIQ